MNKTVINIASALICIIIVLLFVFIRPGDNGVVYGIITAVETVNDIYIVTLNSEGKIYKFKALSDAVQEVSVRAIGECVVVSYEVKYVSKILTGVEMLEDSIPALIEETVRTEVRE
jgi:hypothetical protein